MFILVALLDPLQQLCILAVLGVPGMDTLLLMELHKGRAEGRWDNPIPLPAATSSVGAAQGTVGIMGCRHTLLACIKILVVQKTQVLCRTSLSEFFSQSIHILGIAPILVQHFAVGLVNLMFT